jgi:hypothetical protein
MEYHRANSVSSKHFCLSLGPVATNCVPMQYKYRIAALRHIMAAEGVFGSKVQHDCRYNWAVNRKGGCLTRL